MTKSREWHLVRRPQGWPTDDDAELVQVDVPDPGPDEVLVRNVAVSVDPYMRGRMNDVKSYTPPFQLGQPMDGSAVGEVVASNAAGLPVGTTVSHQAGWREYAVLPAAAAQPVVAGPGVPLTAYLGVLGVTGLTAYAGLLEVGAFQAGDIVFVSGAAGSTGGIVGQIAKAKGAESVIGSAGSAEKVEHLTDVLGFDKAFNYKDGPVAASLRAAAPKGIDVYFDNVGGEHLEAAIGAGRMRARIVLCGAISVYNATTPQPGPRNLALAIGNRMTLRGFIVVDHFGLLPRFTEEMTGWLRDGTVTNVETVVENGIDGCFAAFLGLLNGRNTGKMVVRVGQDPS